MAPMFVVRLLKRLRKLPQSGKVNNPFAYDANARGSLEAWSTENWTLIPEADRKRCLDHLGATARMAFGGPSALKTWRRQVKSGIEIGSNDPWFHHGTGQLVRNTLREVLCDDELPQIRQSSGELAQNWDDFYLGALHALVQQEVVEIDVVERLNRWKSLHELNQPPEMWGAFLREDIVDAVTEIEQLRARARAA